MSGGPLIVTATFGGADHARLQALRDAHFPPERNVVPVHLTLFHHLPPSLGAELAARLSALAASPPPRASLAGLRDLGGGTAFRVESPALEEMRADLADAFHGLLTPQDAAPWHPHVTIQNKVKRAEAVALQKRLGGAFVPSPLAIAGLASWVYEGGPWQAVRAYSFRG